MQDLRSIHTKLTPKKSPWWRLTVASPHVSRVSASKLHKNLTCDSISSFLNLMRDIPEKSMVSAHDKTGLLGACQSLQRSCGRVRLLSPFSSRCSWPVLVDATTLAAIWFTWREACWRVVSLVLLRSAFTWVQTRTHGWNTKPLNLQTHSQKLIAQSMWYYMCFSLKWDFYLWGSDQLCRASSDLVGADNQLFIFAGVQHHLISRLPVRKQVKT